jgi:hypothetical protein
MDESQIQGLIEYECYWEKAFLAKNEWKKSKKNVSIIYFCVLKK